MMINKQKQFIFCLVAVLTFSVSVAIAWNFRQKKPPVPAHFLVQIPPKPRPLSELQALPNVCGDLIVRLESDKRLMLSTEKVADLAETNKLTSKLREIFDDRIKIAVYDPKVSNRSDLTDEERIYKRVVVVAPLSAKYEDVVRVVDAVKSSGTNDIWLQIDGEDYNWLIFEAVQPSR